MRPLIKAEQELIIYLLKDSPKRDYFINKLPHLMVEEMNDGGMGSLKFISTSTEKIIMKEDIAIIDLYDMDGIPLFISLILGTDEELFELDVFKADFSPLKQFPVPPYQ